MKQAIDAFLDHFGGLEDGREAGQILHPLPEIWLATRCGVMAGAEGFEDIGDYGESKLNWLRELLPFAPGVPSDDTLRRFFRAIDPQAFQGVLVAFVRDLLPEASPHLMAMDGKTARGSHDGTVNALPLVSAFATEARRGWCWRRQQRPRRATSTATRVIGDTTTSETRCYMTDHTPDPARILADTRSHWAIENTLHWTLDMSFGEDACRIRKDNAPLALATIRHVALNRLQAAKQNRDSIKRLRKKQVGTMIPSNASLKSHEGALCEQTIEGRFTGKKLLPE
jgi:predicted transposase YbfD/YdcC